MKQKVKSKGFREVYNNLCKEFSVCLNCDGVEGFKAVRKKCMQEFTVGDWLDNERDKFLLLAFDCDRAMKREWAHIKTMVEGLD